MRRTWSITEMILARLNNDKKQIVKFAKLYPLVATATYEELLLNLPSNVTMHKVNCVMKAKYDIKAIDEEEEETVDLKDESDAIEAEEAKDDFEEYVDAMQDANEAVKEMEVAEKEKAKEVKQEAKAKKEEVKKVVQKTEEKKPKKILLDDLEDF